VSAGQKNRSQVAVEHATGGGVGESYHHLRTVGQRQCA